MEGQYIFFHVKTLLLTQNAFINVNSYSRKKNKNLNTWKLKYYFNLSSFALKNLQKRRCETLHQFRNINDRFRQINMYAWIIKSKHLTIIIHLIKINIIFQPIQLINHSLEISKAGKFPANKTEIPFEIPLRTKSR